MKRNQYVLPLLAAGAAGLLFYRAKQGKNVAEALKFEIDVHSFKIVGSSPTMTLNVKLINPSTSGFTVNSFSGTLEWQKQIVGTFDYLQTLQIKPKTILSIKLPVKMKILESITALFSVITNKAQRLCKLKMDLYTPLGKVTHEQDILIGPPKK